MLRQALSLRRAAPPNQATALAKPARHTYRRVQPQIKMRTCSSSNIFVFRPNLVFWIPPQNVKFMPYTDSVQP